MAKKGSLITATYDNGVLSLAVAGVDTIAITIADLSDGIREQGLVHGLVQKVSDAAAIPAKDLPDDAAEAAKVKYNAMLAVADRLKAGEWKARAGDGSGPVAGVIFRAFSQWAGEMAKAAKKPAPTPDALRARYDAMPRAEQLALRKIPRIGEIVAELNAAKASNGAAIDADALLAGLLA